MKALHNQSALDNTSDEK